MKNVNHYGHVLSGMLYRAQRLDLTIDHITGKLVNES